MHAHLRVARPSNDLETLVTMYRDGLGFERLGSFCDHDGFDGVMLGHPDAAYHLEFTRERGGSAVPAPSKESLLVFYVPAAEEWGRACERMERAGFRRVPSHNPYWDVLGRSFEDPDGYRVVIQRAPWPATSARTP